MWGDNSDLAVLALAALLDLTVGEPPRRLHPTVWIGRTVALAEGFAPKSPVAGLVSGVVIVLAIISLWSAAVYFVVEGLHGIHQAAYIVVGGVLLKTTFSVKMLHQAAAQVRNSLRRGDIDQVRGQMASLVSRDPAQLTPEQATAATVESVSENMGDSFVGPWLAFALFGLPGAVAYRAVNTLDSMIGYHGLYEHLGKASARLDDLVNLIPARLTGLLLVLASFPLPDKMPPRRGASCCATMPGPKVPTRGGA